MRLLGFQHRGGLRALLTDNLLQPLQHLLHRCHQCLSGRHPEKCAAKGCSLGAGSFGSTAPLLSSETTAKGTGLGVMAGKEDPVELDSSLTL